jgi:DNA-binding SARP family transcriptional activator
MRFSLLGPLAAEADDGTPLAIGRPSQRTTLAVLLMHSSQPPTKALLIDSLWGDSPPGDAETALRVRIRDLRKVLGPHGRLETHQQGYQIKVKPGELDADTFRSLVRHGRAALDAGNAEDAARVLDQACRLWAEPPLADLPDTPAMRTAATALLEQLREAREWLIDSRLALGQHHDVLGQIRAAIASDPLREHPHVQLMLALYRGGQKAAALAAYGRLRDLTSRELGQDPGPEAREVLGLILDDSPYLQFRQRSPVAGLDTRPVWTPVCQLPAPPSDFTGRVAAIEALARYMSAAGMAVTVICGPPGAGKTALAIRAAHLARSVFPDGQLYVSLGGTGRPVEPLDILGELVRSLGVLPGRVPDGLGERAGLYRSLLAGRRVLVVADDAAAAAQVRALRPGSPGSAMLVTSTRRLADLEGARHLAISALTPAEALGMLGRIVGEDRIESEPLAAAAISAACAGLPLAVRIAGSRLAVGSLVGMADLAYSLSGGDMLAEFVVGDLSVTGRLDIAWRSLDLPCRQALRALSLIGRCDLDPGTVLSAASGSRAVLQSLLDSCLLEHTRAGQAYRLAPLLGCYAAAKLSP